jgi:hypothetical protein
MSSNLLDELARAGARRGLPWLMDQNKNESKQKSAAFWSVVARGGGRARVSRNKGAASPPKGIAG